MHFCLFSSVCDSRCIDFDLDDLMSKINKEDRENPTPPQDDQFQDEVDKDEL